MSWKSQIFTHFRGILGGSSQDSWKSSRDYPKRLSKRDSWRISRARGSSALKTRRPRLANLKFPVIWEDYLRILERLAEIIPRLSKSWRGDCVLIISNYQIIRSELKTRLCLENLKFPVIWEDYLRILERLAEIIPRLSKSWRGDCVLII